MPTEPLTLKVGDKVEKIKGYTFVGYVVSVVKKRDQSLRYVVENQDGILHIFNRLQLRTIGE
jgi:hypothetical protein